MISRLAVSVFAALALLAASAMASEDQQSAQASLSEAIDASHNSSQLLQVASTAVRRGEPEIAIAAMERLVEIRPFNQAYALQLAALYAESDKKPEAFTRLHTLQEQGMAADLDAIPGLDNIRGYPLYSHLRDKMNEAYEEYGSLSKIAQLDREDFFAAALAWREGDFLIGSIRSGEIVAINDEGGNARTIVDSDQGRELGSISGLAFAPDGESFWATVNPLRQHVAYDSEAKAVARIYQFSLDGSVLREVALPEEIAEGAQLADLVVDSQGVVYSVDQALARVYRIHAGSDMVEVIGNAPRLTSLRAITLNDSEDKLVLADFALGLILLDLSTGKPSVVGASPMLNLGGIEALALRGTTLMAVQSAHSPQRILSLELSEDFSIVERGIVQAKANPEMMYPMRGVIAGEQFVFVANSYLPLLGRGGSYSDQPSFEPAALFGVPVAPSIGHQLPEQQTDLPPEMLRRR